MVSSKVVVGCLLLLMSQHAAANWMDAPYGDDDFNARIEYNHNVTLECDDDRINPVNYVPLYWIRPDLTIMQPNDMQEFWTLDGMAGWIVNSDATEIYLYNIQERHFGFYYCVMDPFVPGEDMVVVKKALNYKGAYFGDLWPDYEMNVIIGCSTAGGFLVLALIIFLTVKFRYRPPEDSTPSGSSIEDPDPKDDTFTVSFNSAAEKPPIPDGAAVDSVGPGLTQNSTHQVQVYDNSGFEMDEKYGENANQAPEISATAGDAVDEDVREATESLDRVIMEGMPSVEDPSPYESLEPPEIEPKNEPQDTNIDVSPIHDEEATESNYEQIPVTEL